MVESVLSMLLEVSFVGLSKPPPEVVLRARARFRRISGHETAPTRGLSIGYKVEKNP